MKAKANVEKVNKATDEIIKAVNEEDIKDVPEEDTPEEAAKTEDTYTDEEKQLVAEFREKKAKEAAKTEKKKKVVNVLKKVGLGLSIAGAAAVGFIAGKASNGNDGGDEYSFEDIPQGLPANNDTTVIPDVIMENEEV